MSDKQSNLSNVTKRSMDVVGALAGLLVCLPVMLILIILVWFKAGAPVFYCESRIGREQKPFRLYKFRSMKRPNGSGESTVATGNDPRILAFGRGLRRTHLDELPQLWNVLKGDMSLVGPRPFKPSHFSMLSEGDQALISSVRPGLTGPDALDFIAEDDALIGVTNPESVYLNAVMPEKVRRQIQYIHTRSVCMDIILIVRTLCAAFSQTSRRRSIDEVRAIVSRSKQAKSSGH